MKLTNEQIADLEDMITRRMKNTGENREQASEHIAKYLMKLHNARFS